MSSEEQLIQLLLQLKKTTPAAARGILNERPQIAYALISLMVSMNAINIQVFQKILSEFSGAPASGSTTAAVAPAPTPTPVSAPAPLSAIPPHMHSAPHSRTNTPPTGHNPYAQNQPPLQAPTTYPGYPAHTPTPPLAGHGQYGHGHGRGTPTGGPAYNGGYGAPAADYGGTPPPRPAPVAPAPAMTDVLAGIPEDQRQMLMGVLSMTPEQINNLPPADRASILQLRATLGLH